jgi:glycine hydroxymethyltransferase
MNEQDVEQVADFIAEALADHTNIKKLHALRDRVFAFNRAVPLPY